MKLTDKDKSRFWSKVDKSGDCWTWTASKNHGGYGQFGANGKGYISHRVSWSISNGDIPKGMLICHHCDNPPCVNPDHLFLGTYQDNMDDKMRKGRHGTQKVRTRDIPIMMMCRRKGMEYSDIADLFSLSTSTVNNILIGRAWSSITGIKWDKVNRNYYANVDI